MSGTPHALNRIVGVVRDLIVVYTPNYAGMFAVLPAHEELPLTFETGEKGGGQGSACTSKSHTKKLQFFNLQG